MTENKKYLGSCVCGQVKYEIEGKLNDFYLCHCSRCQKASGSSNAANVFSRNASLHWVLGQENTKMYSLNGTRFTRHFCTNCGCALPYTIGERKIVVIPAGSLDTKLDIKPTAHIFYTSKASWEVDLENVVKRDHFES